MALPNPPNNVPQIIDVQNPSSNHHIVSVKMPTNLASKWPSKAWGTSIADIGLSSKDAALYPDYVLVDVEPIKNTPDLLWIFQKLDGPEWKTKSIGASNLAPAKFSNQVTTIQKRREVDPLTNPTPLGGDLISSIIQQKDDTGKAIEVNTEEIITSSSALIGEVTDTWGVNKTEESYVTEGTPVESGFGTKASRVAPIGMGKSIKSNELYPSDLTSVILKSEEQDQTTGAIFSITKQIVDASTALSDASAARGNPPYSKFVELKPLDKWHTIMISTTINQLPDTQTWTELTQIQFPNELTRVGIIWDAQIDGSESASGTGDEEAIIARKLGWSARAEAIAVGSISGRPFYEVKAGKSGSAVVTVERTFHRTAPTIENITPYSFQSVYGQISIIGGQAEMRTTSSAEGNADTTTGSGIFYKRSYDSKMVIDTFGPFLHNGSLSLEMLGDSPNVSGTYLSSSGSTPGSGTFPAAVATVNITGLATLTLPQSSPILETGNTYVKHIEVKPWRAGVWVKEVYTVLVP